ncbi:CBS domain-containing protein [Methanonatronarchaeum sp. AMET-Sl]|uniref:CBS domain-containing protein n=1 Tax=Methanonatronarchaeum sp. AMET-Sl TaxID=3037654 RepID=UPI00244DEEA5|nr:CBS domain-containing protein [Methanonatronarchaeum sp. AMET-Sl]WGI17046.1 CBS domain-containing protein [Methanonatronarchaeum sp. AMET-Sl]
MKVKEVMDETSPLKVREDDFITNARQILRDNKLRAVPVLNDLDKVSGVLTRDGVLKVTSNKSNVTVKGFTKNIEVLTPENNVIEAAKIILNYNIDSVPIVKTTSNKSLVGVINIHDVLNVISENTTNPGLKVNEIMSTDVDTVNYNEGVSRCWLNMLDTGLSGFPVIKNDRLIGIITKGDIIQAGYARFSREGKTGGSSRREGKTGGSSRDKTKISKLMSTPVITVSPKTPVSNAVNKMKNHGIGRLPIVEEDNLIGIVDRYDVLKPYLG